MRVAPLMLGAMMAATMVAPAAGTAAAGEADVVDARFRLVAENTYSFDVTVKHADTGWDHYADKWDVLTPDGKTVLGTRTLYHPHVDEQPFTRSLSGVTVPDGVDAVIVRAHDSVHGYGGKELRVDLKP